MGANVWMIVKHVKPKKLHPDVIAIEGRYDLSYAEMPRKVKGDSTLNNSRWQYPRNQTNAKERTSSGIPENVRSNDEAIDPRDSCGMRRLRRKRSEI